MLINSRGSPELAFIYIPRVIYLTLGQQHSVVVHPLGFTETLTAGLIRGTVSLKTNDRLWSVRIEQLSAKAAFLNSIKKDGLRGLNVGLGTALTDRHVQGAAHIFSL